MTVAAKQNKSTSALAGCFGFDAEESVAHFVVEIPPGNRQDVYISEHLSWDDEQGSSPMSLGPARDDGGCRVRLARVKWNEIAEPLRVELNLRLRKMGKRPGRWKTGQNVIARLLGKELTLLAWAIEDADPTLIPVAVANWRGLTPEERWWLYTMTAAASGHYSIGRNVGWRKAVRFALTENPVSGAIADRPRVPEFFRLVSDTVRAEETAADPEPEASDEHA